MKSLLRVAVAAALLIAISCSAGAEVILARLFSDNAVLQRNEPVPVWGWARPGEKITVSFAGQSKTATAGPGSKWMVELDPLSASDQPRELEVRSADETLKVGGILVGEVWLCGGQSNMQFELKKAKDAEAEIAAADFPQMRMFTVKQVVAGAPRDDAIGEWKICSPAVAGEFSAVAYFFGREIHRTQGVPVGLLHSSCGWTPSESWTPREALLAHPETEFIARRWDHVVDPVVQKRYQEAMKQWQQQAERAKADGKEPLLKPRNPGDPNFIHRAAGLWNGSIAPLAPYALRGAIWYQGETNERRGYRYRYEFPILINAWRKAWANPDMPFLFVQVANVLPPDPQPAESEWAELRESQAQALELPNTGMAVTIDIGEADDVHPKNKQDVGHRLALNARAQVYGEDIPYASPMYKSMTVQDNEVRLTFNHTYGKLKTKPEGAPLKGFAIAGADRKYVYAQARIEGETVVVWSKEVEHPVAVRYAWANNPEGCNLYNAADLPASPFRTDDWPAKTQNSTRLVIDDF